MNEDISEKPLDRPKVFVSYAHSSEEHRNRIREIAEILVGYGIDVILDQWDLKEGNYIWIKTKKKEKYTYKNVKR